MSEEDRWFLDGMLSGLEDLADGAWEAACKDAIQFAIDEKQISPGDPHNIWLAWVTGGPRR